MMRQVFKYSVPIDDDWHEIDMSPAPVLHVGTQEQFGSTVVMLWVEYWSEQKTRPRQFRVYGTGQPLPERVLYQGTVITEGGLLVWHLYENWRDPEDAEIIEQVEQLVTEVNPT